MTSPPFGPAGLRVEHGFLAAYNSLRNATANAITAGLAACGAGCSLLFTGHSLGAAMATLAAAEHAGGAAAVQLYTFGSPRVGDQAFASWARDKLALRNATASVRGGSG